MFEYPCPYFPYALPKSEIADLLKGIDNPLVLEIGAHDGKDSFELFNTIPGIELHCFEPDPRPWKRFYTRLKEMRRQPLYEAADGRIFIHNLAVGESRGKATLYMSGGKVPHAPAADWDLSSSIRKPTGHLVISPEITFDDTCEVDVISLDGWTGRAVDFIWMDVQGAEGDVIRGGKETLERTRWIYSEFYDWPRYEGQPSLPQMMEMLGPAWRLRGIYEGYNALLVNRDIS